MIDQVPSDTPYAMSFDQNLLAATTFEVDTVRSIVEGLLRDAVLSPQAAATASSEDRFASEVARELLPFDDAALRRIGWLPGESELVVYGHGLIPVARLRADGRAAHAAWRRVSARAGLALPEASWRGVPYVRLPPRGKRTQTIVVAFLPHQVALTLTTRPEAILDYLIDEAPAVDQVVVDHLGPRRVVVLALVQRDALLDGEQHHPGVAALEAQALGLAHAGRQRAVDGGARHRAQAALERLAHRGQALDERDRDRDLVAVVEQLARQLDRALGPDERALLAQPHGRGQR